MRLRSGLTATILAAAGGVLFHPLNAAADTAATAREVFQKPPATYSSGPLWVWNDLLTDEQITSTLTDLASQNVRQAFIHPRPGLITPYLGEEWLRLYEVAVKQAEELGMLLWIYDENSYPSGFAGGHVPDAMPESHQHGFVFKREALPSPLTPDTVGVYRIEGNRSEEVTAQLRAGEQLTSGSYITVVTEASNSSAWFGNRYYVDLLDPAVTAKFLEVTFEPYRKRLGHEFGKRILGSFTDEPNIRVREVAYTPKVFELFQKRWGYDLRPHLASLSAPVNEWKKVRHNYWQLMNELFVQNWAKPYYDFCEKHNLEVTGHYWDHEWPNIAGVPDNMAVYAWQQRPGIDCLMNNYAEHTHAQFGNARMVREVSSVANQLGRRRTLCEVYGAGGWDLRFEDMKRIADWLAVLGVNTFNEHLSYISIRGARKRDHPQSFSYHAPWWPDYSMMAGYLSRLSAALSQGEQINSILLLEPTTTAFLYQAQSEPDTALKKLGEQFQNFHIGLERGQIEHDMGSEYVLAEHGAARGDRLQVGKRAYSTVLLPPGTENLNTTTVELLEKFSGAGGQVIVCGEIPALVEGQLSSRVETLARRAGWQRLSPQEAVSLLRARPADPFRLEWENAANGILFHQRRQLQDGELLFLVNTSIDQPSTGTWHSSTARAAEIWNLETGTVTPAPFVRSASGISGHFSLPPCGSSLLLLHKGDGTPAVRVAETTASISLDAELAVRRLDPNVLTVDYVDLQMGDELTTGQYFFRAAQKIFRRVGFNGNPWEKAVQFKDEILRKPLPSDRSFRATYTFTIRDKVPADLQLVVERADLYRIRFNDEPLSATADWWLDRSFSRVDVARLARTGVNRLTLEAGPVSVFHELEPVYVLGSFGVEKTSRGFEIVPERPLAVGAWSAQGHPFYGTSVSYTAKVRVEKPDGKYRVQLDKWRGSVARVKVNGREAGRIAWAPWECDITEVLRPGENEIEVTVVGTLKNPLGPHHSGPLRGSAWPANFHAGPPTGPPPGANYDFIEYGLFEPFRVIQAKGS